MVMPPTAPPLSHHDILERSAPFTAMGLQVDLERSDRAQRRLVFRPRDRDSDPRCEWLLEDLGGGRQRLTRTLWHAGGIDATLRAQGSDAAALPTLLARMAAVPHARHFQAGDGFVIARHFMVEGNAEPRLTRGVIHTHGVVLTLTVPAVSRVAGDIALAPQADHPRPPLPEDLLAVLGWNWARLVPNRQGWVSKLRLRGSAAQRTQRAEAALDHAAAHLAHTLAEPPTRYHARLRAARWGVFFRRGIPTFTAIGLVVLVLLSAAFKLQPSPMQMMVMYHLPTLVIALSFVLQELPRFEIPPLPRSIGAAAWFTGR